MKLKGMKANFLGDSITEGVGVDDTEHHIYWQRLGEACELEAYRGYGLSGTRFAIQHTQSENPRFDLNFISRVDEMDADADLVVIFGGTNDFGHGDAPLGMMGDRSPYTFYGACHVLIRKLLARFPGAQIVFMTPLHRAEEELPSLPAVPRSAPYVLPGSGKYAETMPHPVR